MVGQVIKVNTNSFTVVSNEQPLEMVSKCIARGNLKKRGEVLVGDFVNYSDGVIEKVLERKNRFTRPNVANIDSVVVVISPQPKPDFILIDKLLINAFSLGIDVIFAINKSDIDDEIYNIVKNDYSKIGINIFKISAKSGVGLEELKKKISGKLVLLAGQSAVGKTSIINCLFGKNEKTGQLSDKILRGRHTTTHSEIFSYDNLRLIDSPGFAVIDSNVDAKEIHKYYPEYVEISDNCRFRGCIHVSEPNCSVKEAVELKLLSSERYKRYITIYNETLERRTLYEKD